MFRCTVSGVITSADDLFVSYGSLSTKCCNMIGIILFTSWKFTAEASFNEIRDKQANALGERDK